jgi:hypothetical protein
MLITMTIKELLGNCIYSYIILDPVQVPMMIARFICATILHLSLVDEVSAGMDIMKYTLNHSY